MIVEAKAIGFSSREEGVDDDSKGFEMGGDDVTCERLQARTAGHRRLQRDDRSTNTMIRCSVTLQSGQDLHLTGQS